MGESKPTQPARKVSLHSAENIHFGRSAEFYVMCKLQRWGYRVIDAGAGHSFDLLVYKPGKDLRTIQVKSTRRPTREGKPGSWRHNSYKFMLKHGAKKDGVRSRTYSSADCDVLALVADDIERMVLRLPREQTTIRVHMRDFFDESARKSAAELIGF